MTALPRPLAPKADSTVSPAGTAAAAPAPAATTPAMLNPYAPPASTTAPAPRLRFGEPGQRTRRLYMACVAALVANFAASLLGLDENLDVIGLFAMLGTRLLAVAWIYIILSDIPAEVRARGTSVTPGRAVFFLFIPIFNFVWSFAIHAALANAVEAELHGRGKVATLPRAYAYVAMVLIVAGNFLSISSAPEMVLFGSVVEVAATSLFALWMRHVELARAQ